MELVIMQPHLNHSNDILRSPHYRIGLSDSYNIFYDQSVIAQYLNLTYREYMDILLNCHAYDIWKRDCEMESSYFFVNEEDIRDAIRILEPYLIMSNLTEN